MRISLKLTFEDTLVKSLSLFWSKRFPSDSQGINRDARRVSYKPACSFSVVLGYHLKAGTHSLSAHHSIMTNTA